MRYIGHVPRAEGRPKRHISRSSSLEGLGHEKYFSKRVHLVRDILPIGPVAYQVILEPGVGQFREVEFPRVHTRQNL